MLFFICCFQLRSPAPSGLLLSSCSLGLFALARPLTIPTCYRLMEALTAQLQKVNTEIDALNSKAEKAAEGYKSAAGTSQEAATKDVWLQLVQEKAVLHICSFRRGRP